VTFTLNICMDSSNCLQYPITLEKCPIISQTGAGIPQPTLSSASIPVTPLVTAIPIESATSTPTPAPALIPTQTITLLPPVTATAAPHAQPTRRSTQQPGTGLEDPAEFARWYFG